MESLQFRTQEAIRLKEQSHTNEITAITIGTSKSQDVLRTALAMGMDKAIHVETPDGLHPMKIARILKQVILQKDFNLVLLGKQAIDDDYNQTSQVLAGLLKWPQATFASKVLVQDDRTSVEVHREVDGGISKLRVGIPAVISTDLRLNEPRFATLPKIMKAKKQKIDTFSLRDLKFQNDDLIPQLEVVEVNEPIKRQKGIMVQSVSELMEKLKNERKLF
eukprot:g2815.t1